MILVLLLIPLALMGDFYMLNGHQADKIQKVIMSLLLSKLIIKK